MNCTPATPTLSEALAVSEIVPEIVPPDGEVSETVGGVASTVPPPPPPPPPPVGAVTVMVRDFAAAPP